MWSINIYTYCGIGIIIFLIKYLLTWNFDYFKKRGIPYVKPFPLFGTSFKNLFGLESYAYSYQRWYNEFSGAR